MNLLREIDTAGAPSDYLYARVRSRRAALDISGHKAGPADPHQALKAEQAWVYAQLNQKSRDRLLPFFEYSGLRTLVLALRFLSAGDPAAMATQLQFSLLHPQLHKVLLHAEQVTPVIRQLEQLLAGSYLFFVGVTQHYLRQGPGGLEQQLLGGCLQQGVNRSRCPALREMLIYLLDMRNLQALYKHLRWQIPTPPPLLEGGEILLRRYEDIWSTRDMNRLVKLIQKKVGQKADPEAFGVEDFLFQGLTTRLRRAGRNPLQEGLILDYLWRCQLSARNRGLHLATTSAPEQVKLREVQG